MSVRSSRKPTQQPPAQDWEPGTVYLRTTDTNGQVIVTCHETWHRTNFLAHRHQDAQKLNADFLKKNPDGIPLAKVEVLSRDEYRAVRWPTARRRKQR